MCQKSLHVKLRFPLHSALQFTSNLSSRGRYRGLTVVVEHFVTQLRCEVILCTRGIPTSISSAISSIVVPECAVVSTFNLSVRDALLIQ